MSGFQLHRLDCPSCGAALAAEGEDAVFYCTACRSGYRFDPAARPPLVPVEVAFVSLPGTAAGRYLPFWLLPARVRLLDRRAAGGVLSGLLATFFGSAEETGHPPGEGTFAVPAFRCPLDQATALAIRYTQELPRIGERIGERLTGGSIGVEDARKLAHYALIASEVAKPDTLQDLRYEIDFGEPRLLGVPFVQQGDAWADAAFGLTIAPEPGRA